MRGPHLPPEPEAFYRGKPAGKSAWDRDRAGSEGVQQGWDPIQNLKEIAIRPQRLQRFFAQSRFFEWADPLLLWHAAASPPPFLFPPELSLCLRSPASEVQVEDIRLSPNLPGGSGFPDIPHSRHPCPRLSCARSAQSTSDHRQVGPLLPSQAGAAGAVPSSGSLCQRPGCLDRSDIPERRAGGCGLRWAAALPGR